jgi:hypothetical protein
VRAAHDDAATDGSLGPLLEGRSTKAISLVVHQPGIVAVKRWSFAAPF